VTLREKMKDPNLVLRLGLVFLVLAMLTNYFLHPTARFSEGFTDGMKGLFFGLAIGLMLLSISLRKRRTSH